ncbi:FAD-linked oxidase-like protein [Gymnopilus junonius]|uniref:D-lactate dehydrogenase (cytochrome) n=1 Tax=Gymnopilus junonius TaxID=109634 RepID=A0A9P5TRA8_GYMJU|nr:FAD-linked oxidase-like protein [Gymnopilus junonius]
MFTLVRWHARAGIARHFISSQQGHFAICNYRTVCSVKGTSHLNPSSSLRSTTSGLFRGHIRVQHQRSRSFSTSNPQSKDRATASSSLLFFVAFASGVVGFTVAKSSLFSQTGGHGSNKTQFGTPEDIQKAIGELKTAFKESDEAKVSTDLDDLRTHGFSPNDHLPGVNHSVVVYPESTEDVVKVVKIATKYRVPITAYSGATSLEGQYRGHAAGGICVDMANMDRIISINEKDSDLVCQPGIGWVDVNNTLAEKGIPLFFPIDPAPGATIGGMISTGCSGTNAVRYGTAKGEWFLNATVVLPSGEVIKTRRRSRKSSAGFDTTKLFIGAEGTLGIITEVTIRLTPVLPTTVAVVHFPDVQKATEAVGDILQAGVGIQCVELVDDRFITAINKFGMSSRNYPEKDSLFFKFQGPTTSSLKETAAIVKTITQKYGGEGFRVAKTETEADELWSDRKNALYAGLALAGEGALGWPTDVCVPVSKLPELVMETKKDIADAGLNATIVGHVGDGNFHAQIIFESEEGRQKVKEVVKRMIKRAIALDGTCTGEHGVGIGKKEYLNEELGEGTVKLMKTIKNTIDPLGLFNPGKLYPDDPPEVSKS